MQFLRKEIGAFLLPVLEGLDGGAMAQGSSETPPGCVLLRAAALRHRWEHILDQQHPAGETAEELLALYAKRWEGEIFYQELQVDMRSTPALQSHTPETARQEIAALILVYTMLVDHRVNAAAKGEVGVLRTSFLKTLPIVQGLWRFLELSADLLGPQKVRLLVRRALRQISEAAIERRRKRSCPRGLRQTVSRWPRLRRNTYRKGPIEYSVGRTYA